MWHKPSYIEVDENGATVVLTKDTSIRLSVGSDELGDFLAIPAMVLKSAEEASRMIEALAQARTVLINKGIK